MSEPLEHGTLHFFCGKMGAGKTTQSRLLADSKKAVRISEDEWLAQLYPKQINSFDDYLEYSSRMRPLIFEHVVHLLRTGVSVVMDFPANTVKQRRWFIELAEAGGSQALLTYLKVSDETCLTRLAGRRIEQPERAAFDNETVFEQVTKFFQEPAESEGLEIQVKESKPLAENKEHS